jgi:hypothetical protein
MKFKDYISVCRYQPYGDLPTNTVKYHAPKEMQHLFGFTKSEFNIKCFGIGMSSFLDKNIVITQDMLDYLETPELIPHLVNKKVDDLTTYSQSSCAMSKRIPLRVTSDEPSELWRELVNAVNNIHPNEYNEDSEEHLWSTRKIWREQVEEPFLQALVNKMDIVEFSDDESDTDGVSDLERDTKVDCESSDTRGGHERDSFVVCEYAGEYSDYECQPVAVFDTKHKARKFIKNIHKKLWTTKCIKPDEYQKEIRTLNPKLMIKDAYNEPHYDIYSVPTF